MNFKDKLFVRDIDEINVGWDIELYQKEEIDTMQDGYSFNPITNKKIDDWFGDEYIVIGCNHCCGDPYIAKIDEENIPIYYMFHDDWNSLTKIADSFEIFLNTLKLISKCDLLNKVDVKQLLEDVKDTLNNDNHYEYYWKDLIINGYEFLTDDEEAFEH